MACEILAISEILYGIIAKSSGSITAGILTLLVCNECCKSNQNNNSNTQNSERIFYTIFGG